MEENDAKYDPRIRRAKLKPHKDSSFQKIIAVVSGKGGVGKSFVTSLLAVSLMNEGHKVSIMDADITGPLQITGSFSFSRRKFMDIS